jgi:phosphatidylserine/phosphatidylglycerophosphate/cardiolipin synthase-like enzyme
VKRLRVLRPVLLAVLLVLASQPVQARILAPAYPSLFTLIPETRTSLDPLPSAIGQAQQRVLVETNALTDGPVIAALAAVQGRGVDVRVMTDPHSASSGASLALLAGRGVWTRRGNPLYAQTGENAVIIDGSTLLLFTAPLTVQARQSQLRFLLVDHDPLDVLQAASVFYDDWERRTPNRFGHQTVLAPPDYQIDLISAINQATHSLDIMAQTLTSPAILQAVGAAVLRHVPVRVLLDPGVAPAVLSKLVALGVKPRLLPQGFSGSAVSINGAHLLIGSATLDDVSLLQQRELGVLVGDPTVNSVFNRTFDAAWAAASGVAVPTPTVTPQPSPTPRPVHTPHRLGTLVPTLAPTPTPPLTATPSILILTLLYSSSVRVGGTQQVIVRTLPGAAVTITVTYPDGTTHNDGTIKGVGVADATGSFTDSWVVAPNTQTGTATVNVVVSGIGQTRSATVKFTITL